MGNGKQRILRVLVVISAMLIGLVAGTFIGGRCCVAPGSGLAGPAIALGYGVLGALALGVLSLVLAGKLKGVTLTRISLPVAIIGSVLFVIILLGYLKSRQQTAEHLAAAYANLNKFWVQMEWLDDESSQASFESAEFNWHIKTFRAERRGERCSGIADGSLAVKMLTALRAAEGVVFREPEPCAGSDGNVVATLSYGITEKMPPNNSADLELSATCLQRHPGLLEPFEVMAKLAKDRAMCKP